MKSAREIWGAGWREVDVMQVATPDARRACGAPETRTEMLTFGTACNALLLAVRRVDDVDRRHYSGGRERYAMLRAGVWTLRDLETVFVAWRAGARYVRGLGPACDGLMAVFFQVDADASRMQDAEPDGEGYQDARDIFSAILDVAQAAECIPVRQRLGIPEHRILSQFLQNIVELAQAGIEIAAHGIRHGAMIEQERPVGA